MQNIDFFINNLTNVTKKEDAKNNIFLFYKEIFLGESLIMESRIYVYSVNIINGKKPF